MARLLIGLAVLVLALSPTLAAPRGKDKPLYFPTAVGTRWEYQSGDEVKSAEEVMAVEEKDGTYRVTVGHSRGGRLAPERLVSVSESGLSVLAFNVADLTEPFVLLKLPHTAGNKWEPSLAGEPWGRATGNAKASGPERVEVPAGTFQAIRVDMEIPFIDGRKGTTKRSYWYAPGVGLVKEICDGEVTALKSFTLGTR